MKRTYNEKLIGKKFYKLKVIKYLGFINKRSYVQCICDCKKVVIRRADSLYRNKKTSCGRCAQRDPEKMAIKRLFYNYKNNAKNKKIKFKLLKKDFIKLIKNKCYYCNINPNTEFKQKVGHAYMLYNGIDRKNNNLGYINNNCVTCCKDCNYLKNKRNYNEFIGKIKQIYKNLGF